MPVVEDPSTAKPSKPSPSSSASASTPSKSPSSAASPAAKTTKTATWTSWSSCAPARSRLHQGDPIHAAIADHFVLPVDLLIRSYEAFATYRPNPNSMLSRMLEDSEVLYDRWVA